MHDPNRQPGPHYQQPEPRPMPSYDELIKYVADRHWAEMEGESAIVAGFLQMMSKVAAARREFLETHGHLLQQLASTNPLPLGNNVPQPSPRVPNGVDHDEGTGARDLARRMAPNGQGRR
jgi:hypothetical protein